MSSAAASSLLQILQLADSQVPIGQTAHSFGLETLAAEAALTPEHLAAFLTDYLGETGVLEAVFCRGAYRAVPSPLPSPADGRGGPDTKPGLASREAEKHLVIGTPLPSAGEGRGEGTDWLTLNQRLSALKPARESRVTSATLGRRFLQLAHGLTGAPALEAALRAARETATDVHHCAAFGLVGGALGWQEDDTALAYLQQSLAGLVSACQRLMPVGQSQASRILWGLKPALDAACRESRALALEDVGSFTPLVDLAGMRHPSLSTRLFIS